MRLLLLVSSIVLTTAGGVAQGARLDFARDVRPLLSDRCFTCHGFDANARKAGLRLDTLGGQRTPIEGRVPVAPGDPDASELIRRVESSDPEFVMPPSDSGLSLADDERALLRRWIAEGADFAGHWAFEPPAAVEAPEVRHGAWARTDVDRFVLSQLEASGVEPSPEADPETLLRRVTLDLTGLPPTLAEIDAFLTDDRPGAYERAVDRLLASPHFGERLALVWLDAARYADTNGYHHDNVRTAWPYRDWVIQAFNENLPYDRFLTEQLAGDLLEGATEWQRIATAFCRMHNINDEGGALDEEYLVEGICDRIETVATALMGVTLGCARCHDHKYDPFTQDDYYGMYAIFGSVEERGVYPNALEQARAYPARLEYRTEDVRRREAAARVASDEARARLDRASPALDAERAADERARQRAHTLVWVEAELASVTSTAGTGVEVLPDGSVRATGDALDIGTYRFELRTDAGVLRAMRLDALADPSHDGRVGRAPNGNAVVTAVRVEAESIADPSRRETVRWRHAWADHEQQNGDFDALNLVADSGEGWALEGHGPSGSRALLLVADEPFGFAGGTRVHVEVECASRYAKHSLARPRVALAACGRGLLDELPVVAGDWWIAGPFAASDFATAWAGRHGPERAERIDRGARFGEVRWKHEPRVRDGEVFRLSGAASAFYLARTLHAPAARRVALSLGSDDAIRVWLNRELVLENEVQRGAAPDQERVEVALVPGENLLVVEVVNGGGPAGFFCRIDEPVGSPSRLAPIGLLPHAARDADRDAAYAAEWSQRRSPTWARLAAELAAREADLAAVEGEAVPVVVMRELDAPRPTFVLERGRYDAANPERPAERRPPRVLGGDFPAGAPRDRLGFAQWLVEDDHPLTARVHVNRLWQMLFGRGIVASTENFGQQADRPSHPLLLDWLARWFVAHGWDQKALLRLLVTSTTYRQSARVRDDAREADPDNRLLSRFPRRRLEAEILRDVALASSGLLVREIGGPSVRPYQPEGLWREVSIGASSNTQVFRRDDGDALWRRSLYTFWKRTSPNPQMTLFDAPTREFCVVRRGSTNTPLQALVLWNDEQFVEAARSLAQRVLATGGDDAARLRTAFRLCTGRRPNGAEHATLEHLLATSRARYADDLESARALLSVGEAPIADDLEAAELAAWTLVGNALLNLEATIVRG